MALSFSCEGHRIEDFAEPCYGIRGGPTKKKASHENFKINNLNLQNLNFYGTNFLQRISVEPSFV